MTFWVFGYGSLMADGWETTHECKSRCPAVLRRHIRSFDKASIESRGTRERPAPTLRVVAANGECHGVAFEFDDRRREAVLADLSKREGPAFPLRELTVHLADGSPLRALMPMYEGKRIIQFKSLRELAQLAIQAHGTRGNGVDYVRDIARHLEAAGIEDTVVMDFLAEIDSCLRDIAAKQ